ncbi:MAG: hypothetical protein ACREBT_06715 [Thermoplasmata archaeon]
MVDGLSDVPDNDTNVRPPWVILEPGGVAVGAGDPAVGTESPPEESLACPESVAPIEPADSSVAGKRVDATEEATVTPTSEPEKVMLAELVTGRVVETVELDGVVAWGSELDGVVAWGSELEDGEDTSVVTVGVASAVEPGTPLPWGDPTAGLASTARTGTAAAASKMTATNKGGSSPKWPRRDE